MTKYFISLPLYERSVQCNNIFTFSVQYDKVDDSKQYNPPFFKLQIQKFLNETILPFTVINNYFNFEIITRKF